MSINGNLQAFLDQQQLQPDTILVNVGANDLANGTSQAAFEAAVGGILDKSHTKWPMAQMYVARPWRPAFASQSATMATWIGNVVTARPTFAHLGIDESLFLAGNMTDDAHPNATGYSLTADAWRAAIGY